MNIIAGNWSKNKRRESKIIWAYFKWISQEIKYWNKFFNWEI